MCAKSLGKSAVRYDGIEKVTGTATYTTDLEFAGMLYGKVLRSPYPHARIVHIDTKKAEELPGVKTVITYKNTPKTKFNTAATSTFTIPPNEPVMDQYIFDEVVRYVGDEVAAVAAEDKKTARKALNLIEVEYEELPTVYDPKESMERKSSPEIHPNCSEGKNIPGKKINLEAGDVEKGFQDSDYIHEHTITYKPVKHCQLERQAAVAIVEKTGKITVYSPTQTPHPSRTILSNIFQVPESKIRVLNPPYLGGGFGVRIGLSAKAEPIAVCLAMKTGRPVKVVYSRKEDFTSSDTRHGAYVTVKTGIKEDGTLVSRDMRGIFNGGAYCSWSAELPGVAGAMGLSIHRCPNQRYIGHSVYTNTTPAGAFRGFGSPQGTTAVDTQMDILAEKIGMDPIEFRKKNLIKPGDPSILPYDCKSTGLEECLDRGAEAIGWEKKKEFDNSKEIKRGMGVAIGTHVSNAWPFCGDYSNAYINFQQDGSVKLATGVPELGAGSTTTLRQVAAETLGINLDSIDITFADTETTPYEIGSHASRTAYTSGLAVTDACQKAKDHLLDFAAKILEVSKARIDIQDDHIVDEKERKLSDIESVCHKAHLEGIQFTGVGQVIPNNAPPYFAHFADLEVNTNTGEIKVHKLVAAHDVGKAINPQIVEGQLEGSLLMGMGYALKEEIDYDSSGSQVQNSFKKYNLPKAEEMPELIPVIVESNDPTNPHGIKGVGETGLIPTPAAILNAIYDAVGIRFKELPVTKEKVLAKLNGSI